MLTAAEQALVQTAAAFTREVIAPATAGWEESGSALPRAVVQDWAALGLNALQVSPARGGAGAGYHAKIAVAQAVAGACMASAFALNLAQGGATLTLLTGPERRRRWGDDERRRILAAAFAPGTVVADISRHFDVSTSLIYKWRRQSSADEQGAAFTPAVLVS